MPSVPYWHSSLIIQQPTNPGQNERLPEEQRYRQMVVGKPQESIEVSEKQCASCSAPK